MEIMANNEVIVRETGGNDRLAPDMCVLIMYTSRPQIPAGQLGRAVF